MQKSNRFGNGVILFGFVLMFLGSLYLVEIVALQPYSITLGNIMTYLGIFLIIMGMFFIAFEVNSIREISKLFYLS